jgi:hypothetical protein
MQTTKVCRKLVNLGGITTVLDLSVCNRPTGRGVQVYALHPLGICKILQTNMLIRSQPRKDNVKKPIQEEKKQTCNWQIVQGVNDGYVIGTHIRNAASFWLEYYGESVGAVVLVLKCIPLPGTLLSVLVKKLPLTL